jgi:Domain of Unknown Function (DUF1206)
MTAGRMTAATTARRAANNSKVRALARLGLAAHGAVYVLLGVLAVLLAAGRGQGETDQKGALQQLAQQPGGWVALLVLAIGLTAYAVWRLSEAIFGIHAGMQGAKERGKSAVRGVVYGALAVTSFRIAIAGQTQSPAKRQQALTARVMEHTGGRWLIGVVGAVVVVVGAVLAYTGMRQEFEKDFEIARMSPAARRATELLGVVGSVARGIVVGLAGVLLIVAAVQFDPKKARGIDGALRTLRDSTAGAVLLGAVAIGLIMFGLFGFCEARWRRLE